MMSKVPWLRYTSTGYCIGPRCGECVYFVFERRSPLYEDLEIYDCWSCPYACHIWSNGRRWCCSSMFACQMFKPRVILHSVSLDPNEVVGKQLTLF